MSRTYYEDDDIRVWVEEINELPFVHVGIFNMSKAVLKKIKEKWGEIVISLYFDGYEELYTYTKDSRIVKMIGEAEKVGQHEVYEVWKWDLR